MDIIIDKKSGVPLYLQVKKSIVEQIKRGGLKVSDKMPTERDLAERLSISRNTVSTAYKELEQDGIIKSIQGRGTFVAEEAGLWKDAGTKNKIIKFIDLGLEEALEIGMEPDEFLELVVSRVDEKKELMKTIVASYVECNIEQARMFSKQLKKSVNMNVFPLTIGDLRNMNMDTKKKLTESKVIIATFNHVNEVSALISGMEKPIFGIAINPDLETIVKIARYPEGTKFGFLCISEEFKFKIRNAIEKAGLGNIKIEYSTTRAEKEVQQIIDNSDVLIVSPGRYKEVDSKNKDNKAIIKFIYNLDDGSVKALKSNILEIK